MQLKSNLKGGTTMEFSELLPIGIIFVILLVGFIILIAVIMAIKINKKPNHTHQENMNHELEMRVERLEKEIAELKDAKK